MLHRFTHRRSILDPSGKCDLLDGPHVLSVEDESVALTSPVVDVETFHSHQLLQLYRLHADDIIEQDYTLKNIEE